MNEPLELPAILEANTYYWKPASHAAKRRDNEQYRQTQVYDFLTGLGFTTEWNQSLDMVMGYKDEVEVLFVYRETCKNVYKSLKVLRNGKRSNITVLKKLLENKNTRILKIQGVLKAA